MIHLDTSALVAALAGPRAAGPALRGFVADGLRLGVSSIVLYEWWRGPRTRQQLADQEAILPAASAFAFGITEAQIAAQIYLRLKHTRQREIDIAIAACAIAQGAALWTLNPRDFHDIPGLELAGA
jgi:predicted nucleic acid-binding protein